MLHSICNPSEVHSSTGELLLSFYSFGCAGRFSGLAPPSDCFQPLANSGDPPASMPGGPLFCVRGFQQIYLRGSPVHHRTGGPLFCVRAFQQIYLRGSPVPRARGVPFFALEVFRILHKCREVPGTDTLYACGIPGAFGDSIRGFDPEIGSPLGNFHKCREVAGPDSGG